MLSHQSAESLAVGSEPVTSQASYPKADLSERQSGSESQSWSSSWDPVSFWLTQLSDDEVAANELTKSFVSWQATKTNIPVAEVQCPDWNELAADLGDNIPVGPSASDLLRKNHGRGVPTKIALVGPTGVGKTTTIAKLAGQFQKYDDLKVGLITVDTFRVGAIDQLETYSKIMGLPLRVVSSESEIVSAERDLADCDLILVDTVGRSPRDQGRIKALHSILSQMQLDHVMLTFSCNSSSTSLRNSLRAFREFQNLAPVSLIMTKVDEVESLTGLWPFFSQEQMPWSYWTNGQNVPDDIGETKSNVSVWFLDKIQLAEESTLAHR